MAHADRRAARTVRADHTDRHMMGLGMDYAHNPSLERLRANTAPETDGDTDLHTLRLSPCFPVSRGMVDDEIGGGKTRVLEQSDASLSAGGL